ncbi:hypothetical protein L4C37_21330 [Vibrio kagoshimensis]|uniref:hypothetical protein n=1 Tax=Vibrio kagoshimensis TaxID=2910244 RepID=UPI003D1E4024
MKKIMIVVLILLILGGAGAGYYFFFMQEEAVEQETAETDGLADEQGQMEPLEPIMDLSVPVEQTDYYVMERKIPVVDKPNDDGLIEGFLYKGEYVEVLEKQNGWARISDYIVFEEGGMEIAQWVSLDGLVTEEVIISDEEKIEILDSYLVKSDDLKLHLTRFRSAIDTLMKAGDCKPGDFEELGGWVKSVTYQSSDVYFIYCGGLKQDNKIYLNVQTGETFKR